MPTLLETHIGHLKDPAFRKQARAAGLAAVKAVTGTTHNACAATASQYHIALGILPHVILLAEELGHTLQATGKFAKISDLDSFQIGDVVLCIDANGNGLADHVWHCRGKEFKGVTAQPGYYWCVDNYSDTPYPRNVHAGPKTPAHFALRLIT